MLRQSQFSVVEGDTGTDTSQLIIVDVISNPMDRQSRIELIYNVSSTATGMHIFIIMNN